MMAFVDQCTAEKGLCSEGYHLCTPDEYAIAFPASGPPPQLTTDYWLGACLRDADLPAFQYGSCHSCDNASCDAPEEQMSTACDTGAPWQLDRCRHWGLIASTECSSFWGSIAARMGWWKAVHADRPLQGAFCCPS